MLVYAAARQVLPTVPGLFYELYAACTSHACFWRRALKRAEGALFADHALSDAQTCFIAKATGGQVKDVNRPDDNDKGTSCDPACSLRHEPGDDRRLHELGEAQSAHESLEN